MLKHLRQVARNHRMTHAALGSAAVLLLSTGSCLAQQGTGNIIGTVRDASGAAVPNATVDVENLDRHDVVHLTTNDAGFYSSPPLVLGNNYRVTVTHEGFQTSVVN